jgi:peptidoglycan/xylan/chitin deacetylase (PgdA/CDA1 family)
VNVRVIIALDGARPEAEYTLATLLELEGLSYEFDSPQRPQEPALHRPPSHSKGLKQGPGTINLYYGHPGDDARGVIIPADDPERWQESEPAHLTLEGVPVLYVGEPPTSLLRAPAGATLDDCPRICLGFDPVRSAFWLLSLQEELTTGSRRDHTAPLAAQEGGRRDLFDRFVSARSWLVRHDLAAKPVVNLYASLLKKALHMVAASQNLPVVHKTRWPRGRRYAVVLSHDVDEVGRFGAGRGLRLLSQALARPSPRAIVRGAYFAAAGAARSLTRGPDPYWNFRGMMAMEEQAGYRSTFFFVPEARSVNRDPPYDIDAPRLRDMLARLHAGGWEIGVHGSFDSYTDATILDSQRRKLAETSGALVEGIRQHYLRLRVPGSFRAQARAGFVYDSTLGYHDNIGFRAGAAFPFRPFDPESRAPLPLLELPLTIMDGALFWHLKLTSQAAAARTLAMLGTVRQRGGLAVLLWHQRVLHEKKYPGWWPVYDQAIEHLQAEGEAWVATGRQVAGWWLAREALHLVHIGNTGGEWRWQFQAGEAVKGMTLVLACKGACPQVTGTISVTGAEATVREKAADEVWLDLNPLAAGQTFELVWKPEGNA